MSVVRNRPVRSTAAGWPVGRWWRTRVTHPKAHDDDTSLGDLVAVLDAVGRAMRSGWEQIIPLKSRRWLVKSMNCSITANARPMRHDAMPAIWRTR